MADNKDLSDRIARIAGAATTAQTTSFGQAAAPAATPSTTGTRTAPFAAFEWSIALRYLRPKRKDGFISFISILSLAIIALAVAALIIVMSVMNGFRHDLLARILGLQGHIAVQGDAGSLVNFDTVAARVRAVPGVIRVAPIVDGQALASGGGASPGVYVRGIRPGDLKLQTELSSTLSVGALDAFERGDSVIIGKRLADRLGLAPGGEITLIAPRGNATPFGITPRIKTYTIAGTFQIGMSEYDNTFVFMPLDEAQLYFNQGAAVTSLQVSLANPERVGAMLSPIAQAAGPGSRVFSWQDLNASLFEALVVEANVMFIILSLFTVISAFNIVSTLIMIVKDKSADIAILRSMGATRGSIMRIFFIAGALIGLAGATIGLLLGILLSANIENIRLLVVHLTGIPLFDPTIYFLEHLPSRIEFVDVRNTIALALGLSFLATLYPSWRAARLDPVEALRYE